MRLPRESKIPRGRVWILLFFKLSSEVSGSPARLLGCEGRYPVVLEMKDDQVVHVTEEVVWNACEAVVVEVEFTEHAGGIEGRQFDIGNAVRRHIHGIQLGVEEEQGLWKIVDGIRSHVEVFQAW